MIGPEVGESENREIWESRAKLSNRARNSGILWLTSVTRTELSCIKSVRSRQPSNLTLILFATLVSCNNECNVLQAGYNS